MERRPSDTKLMQRRLSNSSSKSFHSIDQFRLEKSPFESLGGRTNSFPIKAIVNFLIILLTTVQVMIVVSSRIYLRSELIHTFLSVYLDEGIYSNIFNGKQFYLQITNVTELKDHFEYLFQRVNIIDQDSFVDFYYKDSKFLLHTQYKQFAGNQHRQNIHPIDPKKGILQPFNMSNTTQIQLYLLQVNSFQIQIQNLTMKQNWYGFKQQYIHEITYYFIDNIRVQVNFNFKIMNAMIRENNQLEYNFKDCMDGDCYYHPSKQFKQVGGDPDDQLNFQLIYIVRIRIFFGFVLLLSLISLYLNYVSIKRTYKILYEELAVQKQNLLDDHHQHSIIGEEQQAYIRQNIKKWVRVNNMTLTSMKLQHYFHLLEFDLIFSTLSNIFEIITAFYLVSGIERQRLAGVTCLFAWMTIFKFIRNYPNLAIMYELIKLSFVKVIYFLFEFLPVFISYTLLGMCLFPKVSFFSSMANSVTTLVGIMMGDSIQMITDAILQKNSLIMGIVYIFSFVLLFMHAIHNTLTSLIKQFFILKKIQLVKKQKQKNKDDNYIYIQQMRPQVQQQKKNLPLKLKVDLMRGLLRQKALNRTNKYRQCINQMFTQIQSLRMTQKWLIQQDQLGNFASVKQELVRRAIKITQTLKTFNIALNPFVASVNSADFASIADSSSLINSVDSNKITSILSEQRR